MEVKRFLWIQKKYLHKSITIIHPKTRLQTVRRLILQQMNRHHHQIKSESSACVAPDPNKAPEEMTVEELQAAILAKMAANGPVDDQMRKTVYDNIWHDSLVNWVKSFR